MKPESYITTGYRPGLQEGKCPATETRQPAPQAAPRTAAITDEEARQLLRDKLIEMDVV